MSVVLTEPDFHQLEPGTIPTPPMSPSPSRNPRSPKGNRSRSPRQPRSGSRRLSRREETRRLLEEDQQIHLSNIPAAADLPNGSAGTVSADEPEGPSFRDAVAELAEAGSKGADKKRDATSADWEEFFTALFGFASVLLVWFLVAGKGVTKAQRQEFELTDDEASSLARPSGRILARSWVNAAWGKNILGGSDYILVALVLTEYIERVAPLIRERLKDLPQRPRREANTRHGAARRPAEAPIAAAPPREERDGVVEGPARQQGAYVYPANLT